MELSGYVNSLSRKHMHEKAEAHLVTLSAMDTTVISRANLSVIPWITTSI
jgi:hypothetical protein